MKKKILAACAATALAMTMVTNLFSYALQPLPYSSFQYNNTDDFLYALEYDFDESFYAQINDYGYPTEEQAERLKSFIADVENYGIYIPYINGEDLSANGFNMYTIDMYDRTNIYFQSDRVTGIEYMNEALIDDDLKVLAQEKGISALLNQLNTIPKYDNSYETTYTIGGNEYNVLVGTLNDDPRMFMHLLHENSLFRIALNEETATANSTLEHLTFQQVCLNSQYELGDVNGDSKFGVSDVVLLQKWLLSAPDTHLANWKAADFCEDGKLDVFDLCLMKRAMIYDDTSQTTDPITP